HPLLRRHPTPNPRPGHPSPPRPQQNRRPSINPTRTFVGAPPGTWSSARSSHGRAAAVGGEYGAVNEAASVGGEEPHRLGDLLGSGGTVRGCGRGHLLEGLAVARGAFGAGGAWADRVDADSARAVFGGPRLCEQYERGFAGAVEAQSDEAELG